MKITHKTFIPENQDLSSQNVLQRTFTTPKAPMCWQRPWRPICRFTVQLRGRHIWGLSWRRLGACSSRPHSKRSPYMLAARLLAVSCVDAHGGFPRQHFFVARTCCRQSPAHPSRLCAGSCPGTRCVALLCNRVAGTLEPILATPGRLQFETPTANAFATCLQLARWHCHV